MPRAQTIRSPNLKRVLPEAEPSDLTDTSALTDVTVTGHAWTDLHATSFGLDGVRLQRCTMSGANVTRADWRNVVANGCDLSASSFEETTLDRVELVDCTLVGARWSAARLSDVHFVRCRLDLASFWSARFQRVSFEECKLREADFHGADLSGVVFSDCDLERVNLADTTLKGTDLISSQIGGIQVGARSLPGLIVNREQAVELAVVLGLVVR